MLDSILPLYDVKLISINDNIDGLKNEKDSYLLKALLNIYNENYPNNKVYIGDLIQQKRKRISFKNHKLIKTAEDELIITKNHHMPIIEKEQFERVQI